MKNNNLIPLRDIAKEVGINERKARKLLRSHENKANHNYYWMFTPRERRHIVSVLKRLQ